MGGRVRGLLSKSLMFFLRFIQPEEVFKWGMDLIERGRKLPLKRRQPRGNPLHHLSEQVCPPLGSCGSLIPCSMSPALLKR